MSSATTPPASSAAKPDAHRAPIEHPVTDRVREAMAVTLRGCEELLPQEDWLKKLARSAATGTPLRILFSTTVWPRCRTWGTPSSR